MSVQSLFLPCAAGVEPWLAAEAQRICGPALTVEEARGGVWVDASVEQALDVTLRLNLQSRLAQRVLWLLAQGGYEAEGDLYDLARQVHWPDWIAPEQTLRVDVTAQRSPLRSLHFAGLRIKDAVCDHLREARGERPSVDTQRPDLPLILHLTADHAHLYADTSGQPLFKRGWREDKGEAPLKETLAAAMLAAADWQGRESDGPLFDPCCGAGTIAIEAAQIACDIAPGLQRRFACERWAPFREQHRAWQSLRDQLRARVRRPEVAVHAGDVAYRLTDFATRNAERAGVRQAIEFKTADALQRPAPAPSGVLMLNPPYGERIGPKGSQASRDAAPADFFERLAAHWKRQYTGWMAWLLSPDMKLPQAMRLKAARRIPMWNGAIECRFYRFDLVAGSLREPAGGTVDPAEHPATDLPPA